MLHAPTTHLDDLSATPPAAPPADASPAARSRRLLQAILVGLLLVALVLATYWQFVGEFFHGGDTWPHIWTSRVQGPADVARLLTTPLLTGTVFPDTVARFYRPVSSLSYALDYALFGMDPFAFHLTDLVVHALGALLVCWVATRVGLPVWAAGLGAATFALHPVMVSVVPSLPRRHDSLAAAALLASLALLAWACTQDRSRQRFGGGPGARKTRPPRSAEDGRASGAFVRRTAASGANELQRLSYPAPSATRAAVLAALLLEVVAAWAKEVGYAEVLLVGPLLVATTLAAGRPLRRHLRRIATLVGLCLGTSVLLIGWRLAVLGGIGGYLDAPSPLVNVDVAINDYVQYLAWPFGQAVPRSPRGWLEVFGGLLLVSGLPWLFARRAHRVAIAFGWVWLLVFLAFQTGTRSLAPYQMYTAIASLAFLVGGILAASIDLLRRAPRPERLGASLVGLLGVVVVCGGALRSSALLTSYPDWHRAGELARQYLATIQPCLDQVPPGDRVEFDRYPGGIVDGTSDFVLLQPGILGDYSVGPAVYLTMPQYRDRLLSARGADDLPRAPRAMQAQCEQRDGIWHITGVYDVQP